MSFDQSGDGPRIDLEDLKKYSNQGKGAIRWVLLAIVLGVIAFDSVYTIKPEEVGIILRLGRYLGPESDAGPGLHVKLPLIDRLTKVPVERQLKAEFGFRSQEIGVRSSFVEQPDEASMLTGDLNAAMVEWVVQYRIIDAYRYTFRVRNVEGTFRDMSEAVMRKIVGDRTVNEVLTVGRAEIEDQVALELQELCNQYENGIRVDQVVLQSINPPDPVKPSFNEVNQAEQELERLINEAQSEYNRLIPRAQGEALQTVQQAEGYATDRVNRAEGDAERFAALYEEYRKAPEVTRKRLYLETMNRVLQQAGRKVVVDDQLEGLTPLLGVENGQAATRAAAAEQGQGGGSN